MHLIVLICWAEARIKIARMTLTIKLDGNWSSFQLANSAPPLSVTDSAIAPSARMGVSDSSGVLPRRRKCENVRGLASSPGRPSWPLQFDAQVPSSVRHAEARTQCTLSATMNCRVTAKDTGSVVFLVVS